MDEQTAVGTVDGGPAQGEDWKGRALTAEARVVELEGQMRVIRVVVAEFDETR